MFELLAKLFEVVAAPRLADAEKQMRKYYKTTLNTKLVKNTWVGEKHWLKFWLLTNGDVIPVISSHAEVAVDAGLQHYDLVSSGAFSAAIIGNELSLKGSKRQRCTSDQISKLRNLYIEYKFDTLTIEAGYDFRTGVKSSKELSYYLEYGKEEWESKTIDEIVATLAIEKQLRNYYKKVLNTKLVRNTCIGEEDYLKFWLLTNGDVIPVNFTHDDLALDAELSFRAVYCAGSFACAVLGADLTITGKEKLTSKQISKLKNIYIEYKIERIFVSIGGKFFSEEPKDSRAAAYYLEYGSDKLGRESKVVEASANDVRRKHRSIKRLFPDFDDKTKGVEDMGGLRFVEQDPETWKFKIHSGTKKAVWYDAYLHFKNVKPTLERMVKDRRFWVADKTKVDLRKLAKEFMRKADIQLLCSCPADLYYGGQYIRSLDKYDAKYMDSEDRPPNVRNPKKYGAVCKHLDRLLKVLPFYSSTLAKWIADFYRRDITAWEKESQEEFWGGVKQAHAAMQKAREEAPEIEEPEPEVEEPVVEPEEEPKEEPVVTKELEKEIAKREEEVSKEEIPKEGEPGEPEEPEGVSKEPEEEEEEEPGKIKPKKKLKKSTPKIAPGAVQEPEKPQWADGTGEKPEEEYY